MNKTLRSSNVNQNLNEQCCKHEPEMGRKCQKAAKATFFNSFNSKALANKPGIDGWHLGTNALLAILQMYQNLSAKI
ncbi:hypothetical protein Osc7112_5930 [Oscillatoria nigro-viridis PCC 7112]|uniref:Uncharacterized protein n=1 Tax=Phormidium nigroviride PCC 7112 TaxID=179408 RepID=K9VPW9_9CYAN|nr:hypothetical protein [Oscillatoria nigro-viridis]AFZ10128.1 hypothetical protein Osc7112_5930 [Oscillatoria nigro-viridis PCC 7112]